MNNATANTAKRQGIENLRKWKKGESGNPSGRPKLPEEIKFMKTASLERAIQIFYQKIHDEKYIEDLKPDELTRFLEVGFDRFGLPKVTKSEIEVKEGTAERLKKARERAFGGRVDEALDRIAAASIPSA